MGKTGRKKVLDRIQIGCYNGYARIFLAYLESLRKTVVSLSDVNQSSID